MSQTKSAPRVKAYAQNILENINILKNAYFEALKNGSMTLEHFQKTQQQFYFAVLFFSRPMAILVGKIPNPRDRLDILHNVMEEHGDLDQDAFHEATFKQFMQSIGSVALGPDVLPLCPQLRAFNSVLLTACTFDELEVGVCCMGIIELAFADISALIGKAVVDRHWVKQEDLVHYKLHAEIDARHSEEFFCVVEKYWDEPKRQHYIKQGLELGAYIFDRLYRDLNDLK
jgi:pyrroloquinoline-quinone synthase